VKRALATLFAGAVSKDTVSRVWRKVKSDWDAWNAHSLAEEPIVRLILDGTVVRVRLDRKATAIHGQGAYLVAIIGGISNVDCDIASLSPTRAERGEGFVTRDLSEASGIPR
jgi:hypothetical protein